MLSLRFIFAVTIVYFSDVGTSIKLPAGIKTCKRNADDFSSCLKLAIQESWPTLVKGIPELDLPVLDPFFEEYYEFNIGSKDLHGQIIAENVHFYGFKNTTFLATRPNYINDKFNLEVDLFLPKTFVEGKMNVNANLVNFKLNGKSDFNITLDNVKVTWYLYGSVKDDKWILNNYIVRPIIGGLKIWAEDLFNGSPELTKVVIDFVNEFWPTLYPGIIPYGEEVWSKRYTPILANIFAKLSFDEVFPPS